MEFVPVAHPKFHKAQRKVFLARVTPDCMNHQCALLKHGNRVMLDACCQYGVDVDIAERDNILAHAPQIRDLLIADARDRAWFKDALQEDPDFPSGRYVRTQTHGEGCIFLAHDQRGCAIHRASIEGDWDYRGTKPHVCRLFPLSYESDAIVVSDDYVDYSCSRDEAAPSIYRVARDVLAEIFGDELVAALDAAEAQVIEADRLVEPRTLASRSL